MPRHESGHSRRAPRRIQHAHRVRQPVGALDGRSRRHFRPRRLASPHAAWLVAVALVALVLSAVRPWDVRLDGALGGSIAEPGVPTHAGVAGAPTIGPHGDGINGAGTARDVAGPRRVPARVRAGRTAPLPPALLTGYQWPIQNARITNSYGLGRPGSFHVDGIPFHDGIDVSSFCGARITAAHDGVVLAAGRRHQSFQGWVGDLGPFVAKVEADRGWRSQAITVVIDDGNGYRSVYAHLGVAAVQQGDKVQAGELIGWEGASGNATGCHLHYALFSPLETDTLALDPKIARKTKLPSHEIARIDPLLVFPPPADAGISWGWGAR